MGDGEQESGDREPSPLEECQKGVLCQSGLFENGKQGPPGDVLSVGYDHEAGFSIRVLLGEGAVAPLPRLRRRHETAAPQGPDDLFGGERWDPP